jgi:uncharacterized membrane protein YfcA
MRRLTIEVVLGLYAVLFAVGCAFTSQPNLQLIGNFPNPAAAVLSGLCTVQCNANACTDYNTLGVACANGLPVQGIVGSIIRQEACPALGYLTSGSFTPLQIAASCIQPLPA